MSSLICWAKLSIRKRYTYAFRRSTADSSGREEYVITLPGFYGELRKSMTPRECEEFIEKNNHVTYSAVKKAASMNGEVGFTKKGFSQGGMNDVMINVVNKMVRPKTKRRVK